jgi:hypothetical protein
MIRVLKKVKYLIGRRFNRVAYKAIVNFNNEVEEIVNKTLANEEIEEIVVQAVERVIFSLLRQYWLALIILVLVLLILQAIFLSFILTVFLTRTGQMQVCH